MLGPLPVCGACPNRPVGVGNRGLPVLLLLPTFLAIVLALYAALMGQSVANTPSEDVLRTRRRLVPAGLMLASLVLAFLGTAIVVAFDSPSHWPRIPGLVVVSVAISLLGIGVGRFESRSLQVQLETAKRTLRMREIRKRNPPVDLLPTGRVRPVLLICGTLVVTAQSNDRPDPHCPDCGRCAILVSGRHSRADPGPQFNLGNLGHWIPVHADPVKLWRRTRLAGIQSKRLPLS